MASSVACVVTTIQPPTASMRRLQAALQPLGATGIVIGDKKGPADFALDGFEFYSLAQQQTLPMTLADLLPIGHYARKNLGYLIAMRQGAGCIYETDDDNAPAESFSLRSLETCAEVVQARPWMNVYRLFTSELIWPRGFPLDKITDPATWAHAGAALQSITSPIQQGLADGSPDVDAVWRLIFDREFSFARRPSVALPAGTWCPFNSQSTWWWPTAYPLMYLPSYCSFRMTDIWRSFVAQRCLWELGQSVVFHAAEVVQERNAHNLMQDFKDEVPGYLENHRIVQLLSDLHLSADAADVGGNLRRCYQALSAAGFFPPSELALVDAWLSDVSGR